MTVLGFATELRGVSGGVVIGTPVTLPELVAAMPGTVPPMSVGAFSIPDPCVTTEHVELERAGDDGRCPAVAKAGGEGAANELEAVR